MSDYIMNLRKLIGNRPMVMCAAGIVIVNEDRKILLQKRDDSKKWGLPGGAVEPGEKLEETARREVFEETGLEVSNLELFDLYSGEKMYYEYPGGDQTYIVAAVFITSNFKGEINISKSSETLNLKFFKVDNFPNDLHPPDSFMLQDVKSRLKNKSN